VFSKWAECKALMVYSTKPKPTLARHLAYVVRE